MITKQLTCYTEKNTGAKTTLDIAFVIDTTGSMGDELKYLQNEFLAISKSIENQYPEAKQRWSLVVYRDHEDAYVLRRFDFESNAKSFRKNLARQTADGGGDFPEAPDAALQAALKFNWRRDKSTSKIIFWVADAPHHAENADNMLAAIYGAQEKDIHIYPIASSGIDEFTELTMRTTAQLTGGRYIFLTDDSGIGYVHKKPTVPCYQVTALDNAIFRVIGIELSGSYISAHSNQVIRSVGEPENESCARESVY